MTRNPLKSYWNPLKLHLNHLKCIKRFGNELLIRMFKVYIHCFVFCCWNMYPTISKESEQIFVLIIVIIFTFPGELLGKWGKHVQYFYDWVKEIKLIVTLRLNWGQTSGAGMTQAPDISWIKYNTGDTIVHTHYSHITYV